MKKNVFLIAAFCVLFSCRERDVISVKTNNSKLELKNGVLFYDNVIFNGTLLGNSKVNETTIITPYSNGKKHGEEVKKYYNDSLAEVRFYKDGFKTYIHKGWWQNGNKKFVYDFNDVGEYHGNVKEWYKSGSVFRDFNYINRKEVGKQRMWNENGTIRANYEVVNGERFGLIGLKKCYTVTANSDKVK